MNFEHMFVYARAWIGVKLRRLDQEQLKRAKRTFWQSMAGVAVAVLTAYGVTHHINMDLLWYGGIVPSVASAIAVYNNRPKPGEGSEVETSAPIPDGVSSPNDPEWAGYGSAADEPSIASGDFSDVCGPVD